jgi:hypothetical protein
MLAFKPNSLEVWYNIYIKPYLAWDISFCEPKAKLLHKVYFSNSLIAMTLIAFVRYEWHSLPCFYSEFILKLQISVGNTTWLFERKIAAVSNNTYCNLFYDVFSRISSWVV